MNKTLFDNFDISFWHDSEYAQKYYVGTTPTNGQLKEVENELGYKLPQSYIALVQQHNGGMPINTCFPTSVPTCWADNHIAISGIMGIDKNKPYSLCGEMGNRFWIEEWGYPTIGIAICTTPSAGHDMIFLDYRKCCLAGEPSVVHVDQENNYKITMLAVSFEEFIRGLANCAKFGNGIVKI